nr:MAG TPA: hypothetical protein [Crassvirales sp.]
MMFQVRQAREDTTYLITAKHFGQCLVLFGTYDSAVILPLATFHFLVVELDSVNAHILLRYGDFLLVHPIKYIVIDVRHFQVVNVMSFVVLHEVAEINPVSLDCRGTVTLLFQ